ncbi:MAG: M48 family metalloprotease [Bdellovibrionota bacterium]
MKSLQSVAAWSHKRCQDEGRVGKKIMNRTSQRNSTKVLLFLLVFTVFVFIVAFRLGNRAGLLTALAVLSVVYVLAFYLAPTFLEDLFSVSPLDGHDAWKINQYLTQIFFPLREQPPRVFMFDCDSVNAFVTSRPFHSPKIYISRALLERLDEKEVHAVLAVLSSRLMHQDGFKETLMSLIRQIIAGIGEHMDQLFRARIFSPIFAPLSRVLGKLLFSEKMMYRHDTWAAEIIGQKSLVAETLRKLHAYSLTSPLRVPLGFEQDFIVTPDPLVKNYLPLHVSVEKRLVQLQGIYPN